MPLTRSFRETVHARAERDPAFRKALYQEAVQAFLQGDPADGRAALRGDITVARHMELSKARARAAH